MVYVNRYTKDVVTVLSGFAGYIELLLSENHKCVQPYTKRLKTAQTYCATIIDGILRDVDETQRNMLAKQAKHTTVLLVPDEQAKRTPGLCVIDANTVNQLINAAFSECFLCEKTMRAERECPLRKNPLAAGAEVYDNGKGVCPFKRGL